MMKFPKKKQALKQKPVKMPGEPLIVPRDKHCISRRDIDSDALKIMYRLNRYGYPAFLVGGGVRDLLLKKKPKDFDVSTSAKPDEIRRLFRNSRIIGRRFKINHIYFKGNKIVEVATFRDDVEESKNKETSIIKSDNTYGDPQTDAFRRDLTINGLFYDPKTFTVIDYVGGLKDLEDRIIRIIGDPQKRIEEDPIRMIRAIRHAARANFEIEEETYKVICSAQELLKLCSQARIFDEFQKDLLGGSALASFKMYEKAKLLEYLFPALSELLKENRDELWSELEIVLEGLDEYAAEGIELSASVVFLALVYNTYEYDQLNDKKLINELFHAIGVSKRHREIMQKLVPLRREMAEAGEQHSRKGEIFLNPHFDEALILLQLTARKDLEKENLVYWLGQSDHESDERERLRAQERKKQRRRPRRRRKRKD